MSLIETREQFSDAILEGRFIRRVMQTTATDIDQAQTAYMSSRGFETENWYSGRGFVSSTDGLEISHLKKHRFVDMKNRNTKNGKVRKKQHPVHNRIIWGHYNNIIKELHFGFTHAVQEELRNIQD
jgi:type II secretory pathway component PulJ